MKKYNVKGTIVKNDQKWLYEAFNMDATCPNDIALPNTNEPIEVYINSGGGDVFAGSEIYTLLKAYEGDVTVKILGLAASAASVIAMAGDTVEISPTAQMMIHNVQTVLKGDYNKMSNISETLKTASVGISSSYQLKTGKTQEELLDLMDKETWFNAEQAVKHGFADKIMFVDKTEIPQLVASLSPVIPQDVFENFKPQPVDIDSIVNKVVEKIEAKQNENKTTETPTNIGFGRFLF